MTTKPALRIYYQDKRKILSENNNHKEFIDLEIESRFLMMREYRACDTVLLYMARPFEISTDGILYAALANGKRAAIPRWYDDGSMQFFYVETAADLSVGRFGIREPAPSCDRVSDYRRCVCVCPALCCDMTGRRLGFGGGYYDRFLCGFDGFSVSLCYADSVIPTLPADEYDRPTDAVVTNHYTRYQKENHDERRKEYL